MRGRMGGIGWTAAALAGLVAGGMAAAGTASAAPVNLEPPTVQGTPRFYGPLVCRPGAWSPDAVAFRYVWSAGGREVHTGQTTRLTNVTAMGGYLLSCRVTAVDAAGAETTAESAGQFPQPGVLTMRLQAVQSLPKGRVLIRGTIAPAAAVSGIFRSTSNTVVVRQKVGPNRYAQLSHPVRVGTNGRFQVVASSGTAGRKAIQVDFAPSSRSWKDVSVTRTVRFTPGGTSPFTIRAGR